MRAQPARLSQSREAYVRRKTVTHSLLHRFANALSIARPIRQVLIIREYSSV